MTFSVFRTQETQERLLPRGIHLRRAEAEDEVATFDVMRRAMGYDMNWMHHAPTRRHLRTAPASSFWLAEESPRFGKARVIGYAHSSVRERVWSLTEFFVLPTHHRQGIGRALLARCVADGDRDGADTRLVLASHHPSANALYMRRAGCFPRLPMFLLSGPAVNLRLSRTNSVPIEDAVLSSGMDGPGHDGARLRAEYLVLTHEVLARLDALDREIVGYARPSEHALWAAEMGGTEGAARLFRSVDTNQIVGYAYFGPYSSGPALAVAPELLPALVAHVAHVARCYARCTQGGFELLDPSEPYLAVAGTNETMLRWLLDCGWQIVFQYLFMSTRPLGQLDRYACHNPLYML